MDKESACNAGDAGDLGSILGLGRSPGGRHDNPLKHSCLVNPMDRGAWGAIVHGVTKSWIWLNRLSRHAHVRWLLCVNALLDFGNARVNQTVSGLPLIELAIGCVLQHIYLLKFKILRSFLGPCPLWMLQRHFGEVNGSFRVQPGRHVLLKCFQQRGMNTGNWLQLEEEVRCLWRLGKSLEVTQMEIRNSWM